MSIAQDEMIANLNAAVASPLRQAYLFEGERVVMGDRNWRRQWPTGEAWKMSGPGEPQASHSGDLKARLCRAPSWSSPGL